MFVLLDGIHKNSTWTATLEQFQSPVGMRADSFQLTALEAPTEGFPAWVPVAGQRSTKIGDQIEIQIQQGLGPLGIRTQEMEVIGGDVPGQITIPGVLTGRTVYSDPVVL